MKINQHTCKNFWLSCSSLLFALIIFQVSVLYAQTSFSYCEAKFTYKLQENVCPPNANCILANHVEANFKASSPNNQIYEWDFGDGQSGKGEMISHKYFKPGKYIVTLSVFSPYIPYGTDGPAMMVTCGDKKSQTIIINEFETPSPTLCAVNLQSTQKDLNIRPYDQYAYNKILEKGVNYYYVWSFGDGTVSTQTFPSHTYTKSGTYLVKVTKIRTEHDPALDSIATFTTCSVTAEGVMIKAPCNYKETCRISDSIWIAIATPTNSCRADIQISVSGNLLKGMDAIITTADYRPWEVIHYYWNFGDGKDTTGAKVAHQYAQKGKYLVSVTKVRFDQSQRLAYKDSLPMLNPCDYFIYDKSIRYSVNNCMKELCRETFTQWVTIDSDIDISICKISLNASQNKAYAVDFTHGPTLYRHLNSEHVSYIDFGDGSSDHLDLKDTISHAYTQGRYLVQMNSILYYDVAEYGSPVCAAFVYEPFLKYMIPCYFREQCRNTYSIWISVNEFGKLVLDKDNEVITSIFPSTLENGGTLEISGANTTLECNIYNASGALIKTISGVTNGKSDFSAMDWPNGLYVYTISDNGKIIKKDKFSVMK